MSPSPRHPSAVELAALGQKIARIPVATGVAHAWQNFAPDAEKIHPGDPTLGPVASNKPVSATPELVWSNCTANPAIRAADSGLVQSSGRPKLVLTYDLDVAHKRRLRPAYRGRGQRRGTRRTT